MQKVLFVIAMSLLLLQSCSKPEQESTKVDYSKLDPNSKFKASWDKEHQHDGSMAEKPPVLTDQEILEKAEKSTGLLRNPVLVPGKENAPPTLQEGSSATGFFVSKGVIATNFHVAKLVVEGVTNFRMKVNGMPITGVVTKILAIDPENDLALLAVSTPNLNKELVPWDAPVLQLAGPWDRPKKGDKVYLTGNPQGYDLSASHGIITAFRLHQELAGKEQGQLNHLSDADNGDCIQYDASTSPGMSGSAVLNDRGEVIGVHFLGAAVEKGEKAENLNCGVKVACLRKLMQNAALIPSEPQTAGSEP